MRMAVQHELRACAPQDCTQRSAIGEGPAPAHGAVRDRMVHEHHTDAPGARLIAQKRLEACELLLSYAAAGKQRRRRQRRPRARALDVSPGWPLVVS